MNSSGYPYLKIFVSARIRSAPRRSSSLLRRLSQLKWRFGSICTYLLQLMQNIHDVRIINSYSSKTILKIAQILYKLNSIQLKWLFKKADLKLWLLLLWYVNTVLEKCNVIYSYICRYFCASAASWESFLAGVTWLINSHANVNFIGR